MMTLCKKLRQNVAGLLLLTSILWLVTLIAVHANKVLVLMER